jgi:flagellar biogenesis protein FliO
MAGKPPVSPRREALMVWLKLVALLVFVFAFGYIIFRLRRAV